MLKPDDVGSGTAGNFEHNKKRCQFFQVGKGFPNVTVRFLDVFLHIGGLTSQQNCLHKFPLTKFSRPRVRRKVLMGGQKKTSSVFAVRRKRIMLCTVKQCAMCFVAGLKTGSLKNCCPLRNAIDGDGTIASCEKRQEFCGDRKNVTTFLLSNGQDGYTIHTCLYRYYTDVYLSLYDNIRKKMYTYMQRQTNTKVWIRNDELHWKAECFGQNGGMRYRPQGGRWIQVWCFKFLGGKQIWY